MDPKTQSEQMEDTRPNDRGFLAEDIPDDVQRDQLAGDDAEATSDED